MDTMKCTDGQCKVLLEKQTGYHCLGCKASIAKLVNEPEALHLMIQNVQILKWKSVPISVSNLNEDPGDIETEVKANFKTAQNVFLSYIWGINVTSVPSVVNGQGVFFCTTGNNRQI